MHTCPELQAAAARAYQEGVSEALAVLSDYRWASVVADEAVKAVLERAEERMRRGFGCGEGSFWTTPETGQAAKAIRESLDLRASVRKATSLEELIELARGAEALTEEVAEVLTHPNVDLVQIDALIEDMPELDEQG